MAKGATLLLVHGAWCDGSFWKLVLKPLHKAGVRVEAIKRLPSSGTDAAKLEDLHADGDHVRASVDKIGGPVVLCGHSYGGMVITEIADHPAIAHSVYLTAFWPGPGQSLLDLVGGTPPPWVDDNGDGSLSVTEDPEDARAAFFNDLDPERAAQEQTRLLLQSAASVATPSGAPPRSHPTTYVLCTQDGAIPLGLQQQMSAPADDVLELPSGHFPQLSMPEELADLLAQVVSGVKAG